MRQGIGSSALDRGRVLREKWRNCTAVTNTRAPSAARKQVMQVFQGIAGKRLDDGDMLYGERRDKAQAELNCTSRVPNTGRFQVESQDDGTLVLAEQDRQGPGDTREWVEPNNNDH